MEALEWAHENGEQHCMHAYECCTPLEDGKRPPPINFEARTL
jgi:hypothetical protein